MTMVFPIIVACEDLLVKICEDWEMASHTFAWEDLLVDPSSDGKD